VSRYCGTFLAGSKQSYVIKIDPVTGEDVQSQPLGRNGVAVAVSADGKYVYGLSAGSDSGSAEDSRLWIMNASDFSEVAQLRGVTRLAKAMVLSPDDSIAYFSHGLYGVAGESR
jgi:sugar lactone lactonase YvrE